MVPPPGPSPSLTRIGELEKVIFYTSYGIF